MAEFATSAKGNLGVTLGAIGTGLAALNGNGGGGLLGGVLGGCNQYATKADLDHSILLAQKDSQIAMLKAEQNSQVKMADIYERLITKINANRMEQDAVNAQQAVYNSAATSATSVLQSQVAQIMSLTALRIPNTSVCPGWGPVTVAPTPYVNGTTTA